MGVGHICAMPDWAWSERDPTCGCDSRRAGREPEPGLVSGPTGTERDAAEQHAGDGIHVADNAWGKHGSRLVYGTDAARTDRMRGNGMGIRNVGAMPHESQQQGNSTAGNDSRSTIGERESCVVGGRDGHEHDATGQRGLDGILVSDGARVGLGHHGIHRARSWRPYGMRGDGLGVRHVCEVLGGSGIRGHAAGVDDGRGAWRQYEPRVVCGRCRSEYGTECEPSRDRVGISDGTRSKLRACTIYRNGSRGAHRMRGDGMGVGHLGEVSCRARGSRDPAGGDDGREHCGQCKPRMVNGRFGNKRDPQG